VLAKSNDGASGIDGVTFKAIEAEGAAWHRPSACQGSLAAIEGARTNESQLDASRQRFLV
jgi:hypothetical protein